MKPGLSKFSLSSAFISILMLNWWSNALNANLQENESIINIQKSIFYTIVVPLQMCDIILVNDLKIRKIQPDSSFRFYSELISIFSRSTLDRATGYTVSLSLNGNDSTLKTTPRRHKYQCFLSISFLQSTEYSLPSFNLKVVGGYGGPTTQDEDYYVFLTTVSKLHAILDSHVVAQTIKNKIVIPIDDIREGGIYGFTNSPFCTIKSNFGCQMYYQLSLNPVEYLEGQRPSLAKLFPEFTLNGNLYILKVTSPVKYPFLVELAKSSVNEKDKAWFCKRGIFKYNLNSLIPHFNFTYEIFPSNNGDTGKPQPGGSWNGVIGDILSGRADIGVSTTYSPPRFRLVTFTRAFEYIWVTFMVGQPRKYYSWKAIMWPFQMELWISILISLLTIIIVFKFISKLEDRMIKQCSFDFTVLQVVFSLLGKEIPYPQSTHLRIILSLWLLQALIINTLYVAKIVELLAFPIFQAQPKSFKELIDPSYHYEFGFDLSGGALYNHFESSSNPVLRKVFQQLSAPKEAVNCFTTALEDNFACIAWRGTADYIAYRNLSLVHGKSPLIAADDDKTLFVPQGLVLQRNSILRAIFNRYLEMLMDSGQSIKWTMDDLNELNKEKIQRQKMTNNASSHGPKTEERDNDEEEFLSLYNLLGVIYVYFIGNISATLVMLGELTKHIFCRKRKLSLPYGSL